MRRGALALVIAALLGAIAVVAAAATDDREVAFAVGVPAVRDAAELAPGDEVCRDGIDVPAAFSRVEVPVRPSGPVSIRVFDDRTGELLADVRGATVPAGRWVRVCVRNDGAATLAVLGAPPDTPPDLLGDPERPAEPAFAFLRERPASMLSLVPEAFERAALFRPAWVGAWTYWVLVAVTALGIPAVLAGALRAAYASDRSNSRSDAEDASERSS